jgi:SEC-C motif
MTQHAEKLARYQHLRRVGVELNNHLVKRLDKSIFDEGGKKLGMLKRGVLVLDTEDQINVLMDFCLHDLRRDGINEIERFWRESPPAPDSDEWILIQALRKARYSLYAVESKVPGVGIQIRDLMRDDTQFVMDVGLSRSVRVGSVMAARIMTPDGIGMTTGAGLPAGDIETTNHINFLEALKVAGSNSGSLTPSESSEFAAVVIRTLLSQGAAERVRYENPNPLPPAQPESQRIGRNDPCHCGSGKKFKRCCGMQN